MLLALLIASALGGRLADHAHRAAGLESVHQLSPAATDDCSGFARVIYAREGIDLTALPARPGENGVANIRRLASARRALRARPAPGDLVFFHDTTSRGGLTHLGVVEQVRGSKVVFVHRSNTGIVRSRLDLRHPHLRSANDYIRRRPAKLAGELLAGFASADRLHAHARPMARRPRHRS